MDKQELLKVDRLKGWLAGQVAGGKGEAEYIWQDPVYCLMGNYLADHGHSWGEFAYSELPHYEQIAGARPWTYGAALERLEGVERRLALPAPLLAIERKPTEVVVEARDLVLVGP